jgi:hypothetical protein
MAGEVVQIKIKGIRQLNSGSVVLFHHIEHATDTQAIRVTAGQTADTIRARVPRLTGRLAASVHDAMRGHVGQVEMGEGLAYGRWIEFGQWGGRKPRAGRYVYPTAKRTERAFRKHCETAASSEIGRMHWPTPT